MQVDDPPYLSVGTAVSAKYKGAFCEAKVSKVVRIVKCKVTYKMGLGNATVNDEQIKGTLRVGQLVQAKHSEKKDFVDATITKIQDCSQYTVVFDDGDITTLRRTALCLKSGRHFNESETLDQLPLTHPEHFGNPVVVGRRGRRNRQQIKEESSEGEAEEENEPDLEGYTVDIGRVVSVESTDKKRNKDNWFPGLVVIPSAQPTVRINIKDEYLIRSFKDGRYYTVPKKEVSEFNRELGEKVESAILAEAVQKALKYLDNSELPVHWERNSLFNSQNLESDSDENITDSSDDEPCEEKDRFVAQLYKFMDEAGTPLNKTPTVHGKDVDLHGLFRLVEKLGGYNRVTNKNKWRSVTLRLHLSNTQNAFNQVKSIYKKCLLSYESFNRTLGVTMLNHTRATKKNRGRSLIRDKDRATPVNSPKLEKEDELISKDDIKKEVVEVPEPPSKVAIKRIEKKEKEIMSDTNSSDAAEPLEAIAGPSKEIVRPKRIIEAKTPVPVLPVVKEKKLKATGPSEKVKAIIEKFEEQVKVKEEEDKMPQQTRSKSVLSLKAKEPPQPSYSPPLPPEKKELKTLTPTKPSPISSKPLKKPEFLEEKKQRGRKRINLEEKSSTSDDSSSQSHTETPTTAPSINIGDKLKVYYGPRQESKVTYEAKIIDIDKDALVPTYFVHYTGWNNRYDEWITVNRIAENLSATTKAKRLRTGNVKGGNNAKGPGKRGRGVSLTGRSSVVPEIPRSTTPSSVTSSSSRTKSPATPATRSVSRMNARQDSLSSRRTRRTSAQTDASLQSESESEVSESEAELTRTRSGSKSDEAEIKTYKRRAKLQTPKIEIKKEIIEDEEVEEEGKRTMSTRKRKKSSDSDEESLNVIAKGRDFDLNQIRSELKGFTKAAASKVPTLDSTDKDTVSSADDSATIPQPVQPLSVDEVVVKQSPSSEDIYEFKEPEPFEFESRPKLLLVDEKAKKRLVPRVFDELEKSPPPPPPVLPVIITPQPKKKLNLKSPDSEEKKSRSFRRTTTPIKKSDSDDEDDIALMRKDEDPFDKLVESPSFNIVKTATEELKSKAVRNLLDGPLSLFREIPDSDDMILSDSESQSQHIFSRDGELFSDSFMKSSPDHVPLDLEFPIKVDDCKMKDSDDDDLIIQEQIQRVIQQSSSTDEDDSTSDTLVVAKQPAAVIVEEMAPIVDHPVEQEDVSETVVTINIPEENVIVVESSAFAAVKQTTTISPALQETDSSLLESICTMPNLLASSLDAFPVPVKSTGTKIADSLLQKFKSIGSKVEEVLPPAPTPPAPSVIVKEEVVETVKEEIIPEEIKPVELVVAKVEVEEHFDLPPAENKKRKKVISRAYIEESDSDSSDSEQLVIARSDEDSQTISIGNKGENDSEDQDSNVQLPSTDDSQTQQPVEERNFKFDPIKTEDSLSMSIDDTEMKLDVEVVKEEEPDSQLHSLLLCEETLPRSPAPVAEVVHVVEPKPAKSVSEMPFASAPGTSNAKSILLEHKVVAPSVIVPIDRDTVTDANAVLVNTPPTTPESSISNLSPRGENSGLSPNTGDNESCKSSHDAEIDYNSSRRNSANKLSPYSEEDTQMTGESSSTTIVKKMREEPMMPIVKKRRKSLRGPEDVPAKRGRKPLNRSRHNSDSDDTSDHSNAGSATLGLSERRHRSPRPSKYNFFVEFDPSLDSSERIALLQQKLSDLRKTYADVKTELAAVERRRKKIKRREREAQRASKQELACA